MVITTSFRLMEISGFQLTYSIWNKVKCEIKDEIFLHPDYLKYNKYCVPNLLLF